MLGKFFYDAKRKNCENRKKGTLGDHQKIQKIVVVQTFGYSFESKLPVDSKNAIDFEMRICSSKDMV